MPGGALGVALRHTRHQLAFTRGRKDSIEMIKLINRSDFFSPRFSFKNVFFFNFHFPQGSPKMAEWIRIPWLCGLSVPAAPSLGGRGWVGGAQGFCGTPWCVLALGTPSRVRGCPAGPLPGFPCVLGRWQRGGLAAGPRLLPVGRVRGVRGGGRAGAGATSPGLSTSRRRRSRCRLRAGLSGGPARGAWPVRGPGSSRWGVAGRAEKATRRQGPRPEESWASTRVAQGAARRRARRRARRPRPRQGHRPRRSRSPGSNRGAGGPGTTRRRAPQKSATASRLGDMPGGTRSGPGPDAPSRVSGCCCVPPAAAPLPEARLRCPGTSAGRWGPSGQAAPPAAAAAGALGRRPCGSQGNRTRVAGEWRGSGGAGGGPAAECWYQMLRGLGFHLRNYCPTRKLKQRKSKKKIQQNQPEGDRRRHREWGRRKNQRRQGWGQEGEEGWGHRTFEWKQRKKSNSHREEEEGKRRRREKGWGGRRGRRERDKEGRGSKKPTEQSEKRNEKWSFVSFGVKIAEVSKITHRRPEDRNHNWNKKRKPG